MNNRKILIVIPARGGSKGIPHKNIKPLAGKPLLYYSIDVARQITSDNNICISTDDIEIKKIVENYDLKVPFLRPDDLATDTATSNDVLLHAVNFYESRGIFYDVLILLQPTSPLRKVSHVKEALSLYNDNLDMVVSVNKSHSASVICSEDKNGFLELSLNKDGLRRQDAPQYYEYNGAIYVINIDKLKKVGLRGFTQIKKYVMDDLSSVDIDSPLDWIIIESILKTTK